MHWIIQDDPHRDEGTKTLLELLERADIPHSIHKVVPFVGEIVPDIEVEGPVIVIGSYSMRHVARRKGWTPGSFDLADITYQDHVVRWGSHMLNADAIFCTFEEGIAHATPDREYMFIRPVVDSKVFTGGVFSPEEFKDWWNRIINLKEEDGSTISGATEIMIAEPKNILAEYRTFVVDGRVVTASLYKRGGRVLYDAWVEDDILAFAQARVSEWQPHTAFVLDVARTSSGDLKIVETNTLNAAGFYACDVAKIVDALEALYGDDNHVPAEEDTGR